MAVVSSVTSHRVRKATTPALANLIKMYMQLIILTITLMCARNTLCVSQRTELKNLTTCDNPEPPFRSPNPVSVAIQMYKKYGKTLIRGSVNITENMDNFVKFSTQKYQDGKMRVIFKLDKVSCTHMLTKIIYSIGRINYDMDTCVVQKGNYSFEDIDMNKLDQNKLFAPRLQGEHELHVVFYGTRGSYVCLDAVVESKV